MNFINFLKLDYWFSLQPPIMAARSFLIAEIVLFVVFAAGVALKFYAKTWRNDPPRARLVKRLGSVIIGFAVASFFWLILKNETVYLLGARFWFPVMVIGFGAAAWRQWGRYQKTAPSENDAARKAVEFRKYLPK